MGEGFSAEVTPPKRFLKEPPTLAGSKGRFS
jgi:hypothetical protein